jgi:hypothetical protein
LYYCAVPLREFHKKQLSDFEGFAAILGLPQDSTEWLMSAITRHANTDNMYICENILASQQQQQSSTDGDIDDTAADKPVKKASIETVSYT